MMMNRVMGLGVALCLAAVVSASADDNVRGVQTKLKEGGFYLGEVDGAYSTQLSAALTRYQIRNGLPITGQLDTDTSKALGAEPAVTSSTKGTAATDPASTSETWRRLRKKDEEFVKNLNTRGKVAAGATEMKTATVNTPPQTAAYPASAASPPEGRAMAKGGPIPSEREQSSEGDHTERLRDYVGAFILAGLDPQVGAETDFFADRVRYYDDGVKGRNTIRQDLLRYDARWPERKFWLAGDLLVDRESGERLRVTFPLRFDLRNGGRHSSGKVLKTLVLEPVGDDFQIVAVNERKAK